MKFIRANPLKNLLKNNYSYTDLILIILISYNVFVRYFTKKNTYNSIKNNPIDGDNNIDTDVP